MARSRQTGRRAGRRRAEPPGKPDGAPVGGGPGFVLALLSMVLLGVVYVTCLVQILVIHVWGSAACGELVKYLVKSITAITTFVLAHHFGRLSQVGIGLPMSQSSAPPSDRQERGSRGQSRLSTFAQRARLRMACRILALLAMACANCIVICLISAFKDNGTCERALEGAEHLLDSSIPLAALALGYYFGRNSVMET